MKFTRTFPTLIASSVMVLSAVAAGGSAFAAPPAPAPHPGSPKPAPEPSSTPSAPSAAQSSSAAPTSSSQTPTTTQKPTKIESTGGCKISGPVFAGRVWNQNAPVVVVPKKAGWSAPATDVDKNLVALLLVKRASDSKAHTDLPSAISNIAPLAEKPSDPNAILKKQAESLKSLSGWKQSDYSLGGRCGVPTVNVAGTWNKNGVPMYYNGSAAVYTLGQQTYMVSFVVNTKEPVADDVKTDIIDMAKHWTLNYPGQYPLDTSDPKPAKPAAPKPTAPKPAPVGKPGTAKPAPVGKPAPPAPRPTPPVRKPAPVATTTKSVH